MQSHPRIRKTIMWGGAAVTALLIVLWTISGTLSISFESPLGTMWIEEGCCMYRFQGPGWGLNIERIPQHRQYRWNYAALNYSLSSKTYQIPLWMPFIFANGMTLAAWLLGTFARRRTKFNLCPTCNYDRTGLASNTPCPECGAAETAST